MKKLIILFLFIAHASLGQENQTISPFTKIYVHPHIALELEQGNEERVEILSYRNIDPSQIFVEVVGKRLRIYLEDERITFKKLTRKGRNWDRHKRAEVRVAVTYKTLEKLVVYGEEPLIVHNTLTSERLKLKIHGEVDAEIPSIEADRMKLAIYGENKIEIESGEVKKQVIKSYGENDIISKQLNSRSLRYLNFGEGKLYTGNLDRLKITALGEAYISYGGNPILSNQIAIGEMTIVSR